MHKNTPNPTEASLYGRCCMVLAEDTNAINLKKAELRCQFFFNHIFHYHLHTLTVESHLQKCIRPNCTLASTNQTSESHWCLLVRFHKVTAQRKNDGFVPTIHWWAVRQVQCNYAMLSPWRPCKMHMHSRICANRPATLLKPTDQLVNLLFIIM